MSTEEVRQRAILERLARMQAPGASLEDVIPSGFTALDELLGGGFPRAQMVEIFGPSGCGKTTLAIQCVAAIQKQSLTAAWLDADHTFDAAYAERLGVDIGNLPVAQPASAEQAFEITRTLVGSGAIDLVVVDSAAALVPQLELDAGIGEDAPGLHSRVLASLLHRLSPTLKRSSACVLFLNQMRNRSGASAGEAQTSAGGVPLKLFAAVRILMTPAPGARVTLKTRKNKVAECAAERSMERRRDQGFLQSP